MPATVDLADLPVVDNHCHAVEVRSCTDVAAWRAHFTESPDARMRTHDSVTTAFYGRLIRSMAAFHGVACTEDAVLAARRDLSTEELLARYFPQAAIRGVVVDTGYPAPDAALPEDRFTTASGCAQVSLLRLEVWFQDLLTRHDRHDDLLDAVITGLADVRASGFAGFKSIAAYRTGLEIARWPADDARRAFAAAREELDRHGSVRLGHKPLLDSLLHVAFARAAEQELPVQFHIGYGDPDADLRTANPLHLRAVLEEPGYRSMPVVLLHSCWPYVREGGYLASVYGNAYLDLSYAIPFLSTAEMRQMTRAAFGVAPTSKLMYSSDGARVPELHWLGAHAGRAAIGAVLGEMVDDGDLDPAAARQVGEAVLAATAWRLYGFEATA